MLFFSMILLHIKYSTVAVAFQGIESIAAAFFHVTEMKVFLHSLHMKTYFESVCKFSCESSENRSGYHWLYDQM